MADNKDRRQIYEFGRVGWGIHDCYLKKRKRWGMKNGRYNGIQMSGLRRFTGVRQ